MTKINWNGSRSSLRARPAQPERGLLGQTPGKGTGAARPNHLTLSIAFVAVAAGSAGAAMLAMSLMSADVPERAAAVSDVTVAEVKTAEPVAAGAASPQKPIDAAPAVPDAQATAPVVADTAAVEAQNGETTGDADVSALKSSDPRWAQLEQPAPPLDELRNDDAPAEDASAFGSAGKSGGALAAVKRVMEEPEKEPGQDAQETAAIAPPPRDPAQKADAGGRTIFLTIDANVRSRANKSGKVLGAVPAGVKVTSYGCRSSWCEISYKGLRGWVYSGFVDGNAQAVQSSSGKSKATPAVAPRQKLQVTPTSPDKPDDGALPGVKTSQPLPTIQRPDNLGR